MPDLAPAIALLQARADRVGARVAARREYERIACHSLEMTAQLAQEHASLLAALEILRGAQTEWELLLADYPPPPVQWDADDHDA